MTLKAGTRLGPHEILESIGAGGMGEVYKARDTRLDRTVAIKVLPKHLSGNAELRERFEREAKVISGLNHPHICTLHDVGREDDTDFLVLELIEGETLAERLKRGPLPLGEALRHGVEIADALSKAHRAGVVHRDLKPGNIMITPEGTKLLDFGLAAQLPDSSTGDVLSDSGLLTEQRALTGKGTILGTFQYMAPEQVEGGSVDARTDIFALGVVLYEMVTGKKAFEAKSSASLIAAILERELGPLSELAPGSPAALEHVIRRCVSKDPEERWQSAQDVKAELKWIGEGSATKVAAAASGARARLPWAFAAVAGLAALLLAIGWLVRPMLEREVVRFQIESPAEAPFRRAGGLPVMHVVSPDARRVAYVAGNMLWIRSFDSLPPRELPGTEGALFPFWSPDSRFLAFFSGGKLKKVTVDGGPEQTLADVSAARGGSWSSNGMILIARSNQEGLSLVPSLGGQPTLVTKIDDSSGETSHRWPNFLPDGHHFFYTVQGSEDVAGIYLGSLDDEAPRRLLLDGSQGVYSEPGYVLFARDSVLMAQPFDSDRLELSGEPIPVAESVGVNGALDLAAFSAARSGVLSYHSGSTEQRLAWFDRSGARTEIDQPGNYRSPALSPDGRMLAVERSGDDATPDIWIIDLVRGTNSRLTFDPSVDWYPLWSPDGKQIVFASNRLGGQHALFLKSASGSGEAELLLQTEQNLYPTDWSRDGRFILYAAGMGVDRDIWALPMDGDREPIPVVKSDFIEWRGSFSPDGKFVAYDSNETGRLEIYVQTFPPSGAKWQISNGGGQMSRWRADGAELFYANEGGEFVTVGISGGEDLQAGSPTPLFDIDGFIGPNLRFAFTGNGERFIIPTSPVNVDSAITVVLNWAEPLRAQGN